MELRTLRYFLAAAQEENMTHAADILHVTQPTLSRQMMDLEKELGATLMLRGKNGLTLTDDGAFRPAQGVNPNDMFNHVYQLEQQPVDFL